MKLEVLTNATVIDDAIRFVSEKQMEDVENKQQPDEDYRKTTLNQVF